MGACLDLAGEAGLAIDASARGESAAAANAAHLLALAGDDYGSDDDLGDSEEAQAREQQAALLAGLAATDGDIARARREADERDYAQNGAVLDQAVVDRRLELLRSFGRHLQKVGRNRSAILARLAEPLAEEHWMLSPEYHQRMVDALQGMCGLVNRLPDIAAAAQHCSAAPLPADSSDGGGRHVAQLERLVHEVDQAVEWLQADPAARGPLPAIPS